MKKVLIIGGSTDIGISLAKYLIKKDYEVLLTYNKNKIIDEDFTTIKCDVTSESSIEDTIKYAINLLKDYRASKTKVKVNRDNIRLIFTPSIIADFNFFKSSMILF